MDLGTTAHDPARRGIGRVKADPLEYRNHRRATIADAIATGTQDTPMAGAS
jgi:hypothetical protein